MVSGGLACGGWWGVGGRGGEGLLVIGGAGLVVAWVGGWVGGTGRRRMGALNPGLTYYYTTTAGTT